MRLVTHFKEYSQLSKYLDGLGLFHMDLTLDRMQRFWMAYGMPAVPVVHIVGTNGKGSTVAFFSSLARAHGLKVGSFTSPHFLSPRERVQVNRRMLSESDWVELANDILSMPGGDSLTYFEFQTCLAMLAFQRAKVDVAIMEAGLGGRYDATNVFRPGLTLFTPMGMDHEKVLGSTLAEIARDKAGALREGGQGLTGSQEAEAMIELETRAEAVRARLIHAVDVAEPVRNLKLGLKGIHQTANAHLALAGWRWFAATHGVKSSHQGEIFGLESAFLPGRFQSAEVAGRTILLDGAHNAHALVALKAALLAEGMKPGSMIFTCLKDKDLTTMLPLVLELTAGPILVPAMKNERARDNRELAAEIGSRAVALDSMEAALEVGSKYEGTTLVCGSLYLLAEFYTLYPHLLTP